tara:strand:+ start:3092 stop:5191 length:2100 start_codon:yes stop_codon:yes gene_type:complete
MSYPKEWFCPITHAIFETPVIAEDGQTYEKEAILKWLQNNNISPITKTTISKEGLRINYSLKSTIENFIKGDNKMAIDTSKIGSCKFKPKLTAKKIYFDEKNYLSVKINSPQDSITLETLFICLIDISGSMGSEASIDNSTESHGFSRLDLVKHSLKTIVSTTNETDYVSLITFSDLAQVIMDPLQMSSINKTNANNIIDDLEPTNTTNIWDALRLGIEISNNPEFKSKNISLLLFTDGVPNNNPPRGIINSLEKLVDKTSRDYVINTFGFGYDLDSQLLRQIADIGKGSYSFIPDATMVGTIFVNFIANSLLTCVNNLNLIINFEDKDTTCHKNIGAIQSGQDKDFIFELNNDTNISIKLNEHVVQICGANNTDIIDDEIAYHICRKQVIDLISELLTINSTCTHDSIATSIRTINEKHQQLVDKFGGNDKISKLINDIKSTNLDEGQISKAVSRLDWYQKWGKHYLLSIQNAHILQICNNFKDPGVQLYGGNNFDSLRDKIEEVFCSIPPPKSSKKKYTSSTYSAPANMSSYMDVDGMCFDGNSVVKMEDSSNKMVSSLVKGDIVFGGFKIDCVVKTIIQGEIEVVNLNNMFITPWHPVYYQDKWIFPINIKSSEKVNLDYIYNIVLETGHIMIINDIQVVTLGHNFTHNQIVQHDYYGSDKIISDLKKFIGYSSGLVIIDKPLVTRGSDGLVMSIT